MTTFRINLLVTKMLPNCRVMRQSTFFNYTSQVTAQWRQTVFVIGMGKPGAIMRFKPKSSVMTLWSPAADLNQTVEAINAICGTNALLGMRFTEKLTAILCYKPKAPLDVLLTDPSDLCRALIAMRQQTKRL